MIANNAYGFQPHLRNSVRNTGLLTIIYCTTEVLARTIRWVSKESTNSFPASSHRPWFQYVTARLPMLISVCGWSGPEFDLAGFHHLHLQLLWTANMGTAASTTGSTLIKG